MYRGVLWTPPHALRSSSYTAISRNSLCYLRSSSTRRPRYFSTPVQPPPNNRHPSLPAQQPKDAADATDPKSIPIPSSEPVSSGGASENINANDAEDRFGELGARVRKMSHGTLRGMRQRGDEFTARVAKSFAKLGSELNRVTGYEEIELLKRKVVEQESRIYNAREAARQAKDAYDTAVLQRAKSQREVNDLLQRKSHWTDEDVGRFTTLVREDHAREHDEARAKTSAAAAEDAVEREFSELMRVILNRYHEEQAWSDKIRSASTYGSLAALALNLAVFILAIVLVEPWKRRRLAQTFERKVEEMGARTEAAFEARTGALKERMDEQARVLAAVLESVHLANQVSMADIAALQHEGAWKRGGEGEGEGEEGAPPPYSSRRTEQGERIPGRPRSDQEWLLAVSASAAAAGLLGWLARSWYG